MKTPLLERLHQMKTRCGLTTEDIADKMYVSDSTVNRWFAGKIIPSLDQLEQLTEVMDGDIMDIFAAVGKQEMLATQDKDFEGAASISARCDAQLASMREKMALCDTHHNAEMQILRESYDRTITHMEHEMQELEQHNAELLARAVKAEQLVADAERRADEARAQAKAIEEKRHNVFWGMLGLCVLTLFVGLLIHPPF